MASSMRTSFGPSSVNSAISAVVPSWISTPLLISIVTMIRPSLAVDVDAGDPADLDAGEADVVAGAQAGGVGELGPDRVGVLQQAEQPDGEGEAGEPADDEHADTMPTAYGLRSRKDFIGSPRPSGQEAADDVDAVVERRPRRWPARCAGHGALSSAGDGLGVRHGGGPTSRTGSSG